MSGGSERRTVTVKLQRRPDGGLRAWSDDIPLLALSHSDPEVVLRTIKPVLEGMLSDTQGHTVVVEALSAAPSYRATTSLLTRLRSWLQLSGPRAWAFEARPA